MHKSRLSTLVLDCQGEDLDAATRFWSAALGREIVSLDQDGDGKYAELRSGDHEPLLLLQKVAHESRVHLDIETDDLEAEVGRHEALGASRLDFVRGRWWIMLAPSGHRYCIVKQQRGEEGVPFNHWD